MEFFYRTSFFGASFLHPAHPKKTRGAGPSPPLRRRQDSRQVGCQKRNMKRSSWDTDINATYLQKILHLHYIYIICTQKYIYHQYVYGFVFWQGFTYYSCYDMLLSHIIPAPEKTYSLRQFILVTRSLPLTSYFKSFILRWGLRIVYSCASKQLQILIEIC